MGSMLTGLIVSGFALTLTLFLVMQRTGKLKKFLGYAGYVDVMFTILIFGLFAHTFSGVVAGTFAGLFMAIGLSVLRNTIGYERLTWVKVGYLYKLEWKQYPAKWSAKKDATHG